MTDTDVQLDPDAAHAVSSFLFAQGWADGLPVLPATEPAVETFLATTSRDPDEVVGVLPQLDRTATVRDIAISAVMAGCRPEYLPLLLSAWDALSGERPTRGGGWQSTSGPAPLVIVNGAARSDLGVNDAGGVFGPGFRANATIPRAIGLTVRNTFGVVPHVLEQATQGVPGRWTTLIGESEEESPWEPLSVEAGLEPGASAVSTILVRTCEAVDNRHYHAPEEILRDFSDTLQRSGTWIFKNASAGIVMNPEHAWTLADAGWSKQDVRDWLYEHTGKTEAQLAAVGKSLSTELEPVGPDHFHRMFPDATRASIPIVVAGSRNAAISMVFRVFTTWSGRVLPVR